LLSEGISKNKDKTRETQITGIGSSSASSSSCTQWLTDESIWIQREEATAQLQDQSMV
jgi:hypothetical protein